MNKRGLYMTRKCCEKETMMANISHLLTQGLTTSSDSLSESAFKALNISTVTKIESDLVGELKQVECICIRTTKQQKTQSASHMVIAWPFLKGLAGEPANKWPAGCTASSLHVQPLALDRREVISPHSSQCFS